MIALSIAKLLICFRRKAKFSLTKAKKEKMENLDQCRRLEVVREKARNVFCDEPTSV